MVLLFSVLFGIVFWIVDDDVDVCICVESGFVGDKKYVGVGLFKRFDIFNIEVV